MLWRSSTAATYCGLQTCIHNTALCHSACAQYITLTVVARGETMCTDVRVRKSASATHTILHRTLFFIRLPNPCLKLSFLTIPCPFIISLPFIRIPPFAPLSSSFSSLSQVSVSIPVFFFVFPPSVFLHSTARPCIAERERKIAQ